MALVKLEEGPVVTAQLTDVANDAVEIGMKVEMVTRKLREEGSEALQVIADSNEDRSESYRWTTLSPG